MTSTQTREEVILLVDQAISQGARISRIAQAIQLSERTHSKQCPKPRGTVRCFNAVQSAGKQGQASGADHPRLG